MGVAVLALSERLDAVGGHDRYGHGDHESNLPGSLTVLKKGTRL